MGRRAFVKWLILSLACAVSFSFLSLVFMNRFAETSWSRHQRDFMYFFADTVERRIQNLSPEEIKKINPESLLHLRGLKPPEEMRFFPKPPPRPTGGPQGPRPPGHSGTPQGNRSPQPPGLGERGLPPRPGEPGGEMGLNRPPMPPPFMMIHWALVTESGETLIKSSDENLEFLPQMPAKVHEVTTQSDFFRLFPARYAIRLDRSPTLYLITKDAKPPFSAPFLFIQTLFTFATAVAALGFSLSLMFWYLRRKSEEARGVLLRLEQGDLKARFSVRKFDEFGGLLLDFNRMADEIEKLVMRIHSVESTRKNLLQELGHDLRTPLTSLKTSVETLQSHFTSMSEEDRADLVKLINGEVDYFKDLIEKLMTIAALDEPHYKKTTETVNLFEMIDREIGSRQKTGNAGKLRWTLALSESDPSVFSLLGDPHLILRMFRNAFDNASRFARSEVQVTLLKKDHDIEIRVQDDGQGFVEEALQSFGKRREFRGRHRSPGMYFSLGLGSVIMRTIAELHGGSVLIENLHDHEKVSGAVVIFRFTYFDNVAKPV